ncbi:unnamed protein product [Polarella glacialis]|uniref:Lipid droplet-associated hydrolase n=1 Tax=Polarella glacialis TaxID=89957 RepID=A0A813ISS2_POLGL|nr:unnamed protein product [Polarella glacialis]
MVPGFPGVAGLYSEFLSVLSATAGCIAVCFAWCGHHEIPDSLQANKKTVPLDLEAQAAFVASVLRHLQLHAGASKLVLLGHSLGCWLLSQSLEALASEAASNPSKAAAVVAIHLMCPILKNMGSIPRARKLRGPISVVRDLRLHVPLRIAANMLPLCFASRALQLLWWMRGKASLNSSENWFWQSLVVDLRLGVIGLALPLALEAMDKIREPGPALLKSLGGGRNSRGASGGQKGGGDSSSKGPSPPFLTLHFAAGDGWTPAEARAQFREFFPKAPHVEHQMPHGVITRKSAARQAAAVIGRLTASAVDQQ